MPRYGYNPNSYTIMKIKREIRNTIATGCVLASVFAGSLKADEVYSQIVGAVAIDLPASSDVIVSFPFKRGTAYKGSVESATLDGFNMNLNIAGAPFQGDQFQTADDGFSSHYVQFETGNLKGLWADISSNTTGAIVIEGDEDIGDFQSQVTSGDLFTVYSQWTLDAAFPNGVASTEEAEAGLRTIEVIVPSYDSPAGSMTAEAIYFYADGAWQKFGAALSSDSPFGQAAFAPDQAAVIRNNGGDALTGYFFGEVSTAPIAIELGMDASGAIDHFVGIGRPLDVAIEDLGLESIFTSTDDRLLVYSLDASGKNKTPVAEYYYESTSWKKDGSAGDFGSDVVAVNMGIAVRKAAGTGDDVYWVNEWSLPQ